MKKKQKRSSVFAILVLSLNIFGQLSAPIAAYAAEPETGGNQAENELVVDSAEVEKKAAEPSAETPEEPAEVEEDVGEDVEVEATPVEEAPVEESVEEEAPEEELGEENLEEPSEESTTETTDGVEEENIEEDSEVEAEPAAAANITPVQQAQAENFELPLMHINDTHARVPAYASMVTAINDFRSSNPESLLLHAGDVFSGTLYFNEFEGEADLALLNLMGIDAMTFGNHEFDLGGSPEGHTALADFLSNANFPFLGTNIDFSNDAQMAAYETNASLVSNPEDGQIYDSIVQTVDGEEVGIFGLTTEDTENIASPVSIAFNDYIAAAEKAVVEFEAAGIDKIIALTHIGYASAPVMGNDLLLADYVDGIDIIVGGHSHTALAEPVVVDGGSAPTVIVQTGGNAEDLGTLHVTFNENGEVIEQTGELVSVSNYEADPQALEVLAPYQAAVDGINNEETGAVAQKELENPRHGEGDAVSVRANETPLGNLVTDAMLAKTQELYPETVIAFQNGGGVRAPIEAGPITVGEVIEVLPFGNNPVVVELTGQEIKDLLEISVSSAPEENGGFLHVSGMEFYYDSHREPYDRVVAMYVEEDGELNEIQPEGQYLVTTNAFTGQGGDGLTPFADAYADGRVQDTGAIDWEQLRDYMVEEQYLNGVVDPVVEGRINDLKGEPLPGDGEDVVVSEELLERLAVLEERLNNLEAQNQEQATELIDLKNKVATLETNLTDAEEELAALEARVSELEAQQGAVEEKSQTQPEQPTEEADRPDSEENQTDQENVSRQEESTQQESSQEPQTNQKEPEDSKEKESKESLPETGASSMLITVASGMTLVLSGLGIEGWRRKKNKN